jgi:gliding motility-associated-like protein
VGRFFIKIAAAALACLSGAYVSVHAQCTGMDLTVDKSKDCSPMAAMLVVTGGPPGAVYDWNINNSGFISGTDTLYKAFSVPGKYDVVVRITPKLGPACIITKNKLFEVLPTPKPGLTASPGRFLCDGTKEVSLLDTTSDVVSREWIVDGVSYKNAANSISLSFTSNGAKSVSLKVTNSAGCTGIFSDNNYLQIHDAVSVDFCGKLYFTKKDIKGTFSPVIGSYPGRTVSKYEWSFPGGSPSSYTGQYPPAVTWSNPNTNQDVSLTITMADGCVYTCLRKSYIQQYIKPVKYGSPATVRDTACIREMLTMVNLASNNGRGSFEWNMPFADIPPPGPGPPPKDLTLSYSKAGSYNGTLEFKYDPKKPCKHSVTYLNLVRIIGPSVDFMSPQSQSCDFKAKINLTNLTNDSGISGIKYTWRVYDSANRQIPGMVFGPTLSRDTFFYPKSNRIYGVSLSAKGPKCTDSVYKKQFIIISRPKAEFETDTFQLCLGQSINFYSYPDPPDPNNTNTYIWNIQHADSVPIFMTLTGSATSFTPWVPGKYHVTHIVQNSKACGDTLIRKNVFTVYGAVASVKADATQLCTGTGTYFRGKIKYKYPKDPGNPLTYEWKADGVSGGDSVNIINKNSLSQCYIQFWESGSYLVYLFIKDSKGCTHAEIISDTIKVGVTSDFRLDKPKCLGDTSTISSQASRDALTYKWTATPNDAAIFVPSDTIREPRVVYLRDTCVKIKLITSKEIDGNYCYDTTTRSVCQKLPHFTFSTKDTFMDCAPEVVTFDWRAEVPKVTLLWDFGDGTTLLSKSSPISHVYLANNIDGFTVKATAFDTNGCSIASMSKNLVHVNGPQPKFALDKRTGCDKVTVKFTDESIHAKKFILFYDDDETDTSANNSHTYYLQDPDKDSFSYYPLILSLDDADTSCRPFYKDTVTVYRTPTPNFKSDTMLGCVPLSIGFTDLSTGPVREWAWDFDGDGIVDDSTQNPRFTYPKSGIYNVTLTVKGAGGCLASFTRPKYIEVLPIPVTGFVTGQRKICGKADVSFTDTARFYKYYFFDYGDGSPLEVNSMVKHLYYYDSLKATADSMIYYPNMVGVSAAGCSDTFTDTIITYAVPRPDFYSTVKNGCAPLTVQFTDISRHAYRWEWDFQNDGVIDTVIDSASGSVAWTFAPGIYTVKLKTYGLNECIDSIVKVNYIRVNEPPQANFSVNDSDICVGDEVQFTDETYPKANAAKWQWVIVDPAAKITKSNLQNPTFQFFTPGYHKIFLAVEDNFGCRDTIRKTAVYVEDTLPGKNTELLYVTVESDNSIKAVWKRNTVYDFDQYIITREGNPAMEVFTTNDNADTVHTNLDLSINTIAKSYCYSIKTRDECGNISFPSPVHCTMLLNTTPVSASTIKLDWTAYVGYEVRVYRIYRSGSDKKFSYLATLSGNQLTYNDSNLCDQVYCYYVEAVDLTNNYFSRSNISCAQAPYIYQLTPLIVDYATVENDRRVKVKWMHGIQPNVKGYIVDRKSGNNTWQDNFTTVSDTFFYDNTADIFARPYTYRVRSIDKCGYEGPVSHVGQTIFLESRIINDKVVLNWNKYRYWNDGVDHYRVQVRDRKGKYTTTAVLSPNDSTYTDDSIYTSIDTAYCYRVVAVQHGLTLYTSISNSTCALLDSRIFIPNAFSPNRDGVNDVWKVSALSIYNLVGEKNLNYFVRIVNRWGQVVFESTDVNQGWDGTIKGRPAPVDVYVYLLHAQGIDGRSINRKGNITLLK